MNVFLKLNWIANAIKVQLFVWYSYENIKIKSLKRQKNVFINRKFNLENIKPEHNQEYAPKVRDFERQKFVVSMDTINQLSITKCRRNENTTKLE